MNLNTIGIGSLPFLRAGEKITRPAAGPDKQAMDYESVLETEASTALHLPLSGTEIRLQHGLIQQFEDGLGRRRPGI